MATYRVYLSFFVRGNGKPGGEWVVQFSPPSLDRAIGPIRRWSDADIIRKLIERTPTKMDLAARQALEAAISNGRGGFFLELTPEQYASLHLPTRKT